MQQNYAASKLLAGKLRIRGAFKATAMLKTKVLVLAEPLETGIRGVSF